MLLRNRVRRGKKMCFIYENEGRGDVRSTFFYESVYKCIGEVCREYSGNEKKRSSI